MQLSHFFTATKTCPNYHIRELILGPPSSTVPRLSASHSHIWTDIRSSLRYSTKTISII